MRQANKPVDISYVDLLMQEWRIDERFPRIQSSVRKVLNELVGEALLSLRREPRLEVRVLPQDGFSVWAYFPIHRKRVIGRQLAVKPQTRVLLVFRAARWENEQVKVLENDLRDHLGHVLLYLRSPKARNECIDAQKEWRICRLLKSQRKAEAGKMERRPEA